MIEHSIQKCNHPGILLARCCEVLLAEVTRVEGLQNEREEEARNAAHDLFALWIQHVNEFREGPRQRSALAQKKR